MIEDIKQFRAKLNIERFGDAGDVVILEHREIKVGQPWASQAVTPGVS